MNLTEDNLNRLALGIIEKNKCSYAEALEVLGSLKLYIKCGNEINNSASLQAALMTIVNTGKRAFLGGVFVSLPDEVPLVIRWPFSKNLNAAVVELGGTIVREAEIKDNFCINLGLPASVDKNSIQVVCNGWIGGICNGIDDIVLNTDFDFALGGILGGAIAVSAVFLRETNISQTACDKATGLSLWRPDLHWTDIQANGPTLEHLPKRVWLLGLGHLGQAYAWALSLLPFQNPKEFHLLLQDFDRITDGNYSSGLLSEKNEKKPRKTRHCGEWLEAFGFNTTLTERRYDSKTYRTGEEPYVALCGFDSAESRLPLESSGFDIIVESAIGNSLSDFDNIITHTFPNGIRKPADIWSSDQEPFINEALIDTFERELKKQECGILVTNLASKAMSASFVGAIASTLVISEVLRGLHGGSKYESLVSRVRSISNTRFSRIGNYSYEHARNGATPAGGK